MPHDLAVAAKERAKQQQKSLSGYVTDLVRDDLEAARREKFWAEVERTMTTSQARADLAADAEALEATLPDGLDS